MGYSQRRARLKPSGARYKKDRKKKLFEQGRTPVLTRIGEHHATPVRTLGGNIKKIKLYEEQVVNVLGKDNKSMGNVKIKTVVGNPANSNFVRRNIMTKGTIVETEKGKVRITSRPSQHGVLNGVLV
ncbi:30S ribosomal protein S8e [Candidatus Woesearchaeota archaeon]|nr:30S ribosomal protein S8e [Candidatus Woesearchaeota archaeon]